MLLGILFLLFAMISCLFFFDRYRAAAAKTFKPPEHEKTFIQDSGNYQQAIDRQNSEKTMYLTLMILLGSGFFVLCIVFSVAAIVVKDDADRPV